jgi:alanine-synthesizing transaminase
MERYLASQFWPLTSSAGQLLFREPKRFGNLGSVEFSKLLLSDAKVAAAAGPGFGEYGEG